MSNFFQDSPVLYYNLDELSRYIPENFNFDMTADSSTVSTTSSDMGVHHHHQPIDTDGSKSMTISIPGEKGGIGQSFTVQVQFFHIVKFTLSIGL